MTQYLVTYAVQVEADDEQEAIERADEGKGGGHWEATPLPVPDRTLTAADALAIATILDAAHNGRRVRWLARGLTAGDHHVVTGVARHIVRDDSFNFLRGDEDVRDGYLRVSDLFERLLYVPDVIEWIKAGTFAVE